MTIKCGNCKQVGHNRRTCPEIMRSNSIVSIVRSKKKKKKLSDIIIPTRDECLKKLEGIKEKRPEQYKIAEDVVDSLMNKKNAMIKAEEKTGKRTILEAIHLLMIILHYSNVPDERKSLPRSVYITALNRKDTKVQFEEQENEYGILSISTQFDRLLGEIINFLKDDRMIYIHIDECDYGSGDTQGLSKIYDSDELNLPKNKERIRFVTYSATPEELEFSGINSAWDKHIFSPSKAYCGAKWYLEKKLVYEPSKFFDGNKITEHGESIMHDVQIKCSNETLTNVERQRNVIVIRVVKPGVLGIISVKKSELELKYSCDIYIFDQSNGFEWGSKEQWGKLGKEEILDDNEIHIGYNFKPVLIFISQTCTRSTEIAPLGHRKIFAWHDDRKLEDKKSYNTLSQAIGRVKHYKQGGHPDNEIRLYCDKEILNYSIGNTIKTKTLTLSTRVNTIRDNKSKVKFIRYEDGWEDISEVPDSAWQQGDPTIGLTSNQIHFYTVGEKWCQSDKKLRIWNSTNHGGSGGDAGKQRTLQYENNNSERYIIRTAIYEKNENLGKNTFTHTTKVTSMYSSSN